VTWPVVIDPSSIVLGLAVSCASGVLFGFWPAWQAAKVNPIEALRAG
jgi:ABC-type antimicrobial peptide transport system permease subunit